MDISGHEGAMPLPISSSYGGCQPHAHIIHEPHHHAHIIASAAPLLPSNGPIPSPDDHVAAFKKAVMIKYRECLRNHAASMGGNATDGCGEFMPGGEEGSLEALKCSACGCHRNFHRKDIECGESSCDCYKGRKVVAHKGVLIAGSDAFGYPTAGAGALMRPPPHMILSYNMGLQHQQQPSESDEQEGGSGGCGALARPPLLKKRFRTKFTQEQKDKMLGFAEKVGWKIQKQEEGVVQQFCQEIGVKRRVLKVWMHNNKLNLAKKTDPTTT
ncbi:hypothetical protein ACLOJK_016884 [Asimina triloba]